MPIASKNSSKKKVASRMPSIPVVDIGAIYGQAPDALAQTAREFGAAFEKFGFATIVGHGVAPATIAAAYNAGNAFFDLPLAHKLASTVPDRVKGRGYVPAGVESVARTLGSDRPPDLVEALVFGSMQDETLPLPLGGASAATGNLFPAEPPELGPAFHAYFMAMRELAGTLMRLAAVALDLPADYFAPSIDRRRGTLRAAFYPEQTDPPAPGQLRYGAHTDYGGFTILRQDDAPGGLQVDLDGSWIDVTPQPGAFTINIGDLVSRWTNGRWRSTLHRVVNPPRDTHASTRRLSLVFFSGPNDDAIIECLPTCHGPGRPALYPPVVARDYIRAKLDSSMPSTLERR
jgi:isopenicillin N synthase-like dioxygenase